MRKENEQDIDGEKVLTRMKGGTIQDDIGQILEKYKPSEILDAMIDIASDDKVHEMRMWFDQNFGDEKHREDEFDKDIIDWITHELEHQNMRLIKLEQTKNSAIRETETTQATVLSTEIVDTVSKSNPSEGNAESIIRRLRKLEREKKRAAENKNVSVEWMYQ